MRLKYAEQRTKASIDIFDIDGQYLTHEFFIPCMVVGICILCIFSVMISVLIVLTGP